MAYDEALAARLRDLLGEEPDLTEKKMFGGLAFLVGGHMVAVASGQGGLMTRCDPAATDDLLARPGAGPMIMKGRPLDGWLRVSGEHLRAKRELGWWTSRSLAFVRTLPPKTAVPKRRRPT